MIAYINLILQRTSKSVFYLKSLFSRQDKSRQMSKTDIIKGFHSLAEALDSGKTIKKIYIQSGISNDHVREVVNLARKHNVPFQLVPKEKLNKMTGGIHQGIIAVVSPIEFTDVESLIPFLFENGKVPLLAILDEITDVRNFGAIVRSAEFLGVNGIIIPLKGTADINEEAIKASSGALFRMSICRVENIRHSILILKSSGIQIVAATEKGADNISSVDFTLPTAIVFGSEERGISKNVLQFSDKIARIPASGEINSLNVSVAAGILFYEASRQRGI